MSEIASLFLFLAAAVVAVFAFASIFVWVSTPAQERRSRDKLAVLKTLAENPSENAAKVLEFLRTEDEKRFERRRREEKRGYVMGGLVTMATGVGLGIMLAVLDNRGGTWSVGLIPFLIGCVLLGMGVFSNGRASQSRKEEK
jgi:hypothetical protein